MKKSTRKGLSFLLSLVMAFAMIIPTYVKAATPGSTEVKLTILGTSDMHGNLTSYVYEAAKDYENSGFARTATLVKQTRTENPNTLVIDNGDTIQGTIMTDDLYNTDLSKPNPVMDMMNYIGYDSMTLGNHEFNFGVPMIEKLKKEAKFPILSANIYKKATGENFATPYIVKEFDGVKVGVLGLTVPSVPSWDANKEGVKDLEFKHMADEAQKYVKILKEKEQVDVIIATAHAGLDSRHEQDGGDAARLVAERCPEIDAFLVGHDHITVNENINGVLVAAPYKDREVVRFDLTINKDTKKVTDKQTTILKLADYTADEGATKVAAPYDKETKAFLENTIGVATEDFHPASEVKGIPEAQIKDTGLIDLINNVQLEATGADVAAAALFKPSANLPKGELNFANVFDIYQYANTLVGIEVTGKELKNYMEWSVSYYNTFKPGDLTISFNPNIRVYAYDMFQGVDYTVDISEPVGSRIKDVMYKGEPLADDIVLKLAINDYRYSGIGPSGEKIISGTPYFTSDPKALRTYIKEYIEKEGTITPVADNNWKIVGNEWNLELRKIAVEAINNGTIVLPTSADGRTVNVGAVTELDLIQAGLHPTYTDFMTVIHTNDSHTRIEETSSDGMGFAKVADKVNQLRTRYGKDHVLLLDGGDTLHGLPLITTTKGEAMTKVMNALGYDAMVAGNHDFNYGYERLIELDKMLEFPVLSANVTKGNDDILTPYIIKEVAGKKVAIFGLETPDTTIMTHPKNVEGLTFEDPSKAAQKMVKELEGKADFIVALCHLGLDSNSSITSEKVAGNVKGIDLIVDGHSHTTLPQGKIVNDTLIVQTGEYTKNLGQVNILFKKDGTFDMAPMHITKADAAGLTADKAVSDLIKELKANFDVVTEEVVGTTPVALQGEREFVRKGETNLGNLITNALIEATGADVALTNGGGIRASIDVGDITKKEVITVLPFGNYGVMIEATGQEIKDALEVGAAKYPEANGAFSHVAGMSYKFDPAQPVGNRIVEVLVDEKPIDLNKTYKLATNDFIAAGGDGYVMFKGNKSLGEFSALDELVIEYLSTKGVEGIEVNGRIVPITSEVEQVELKPAA
ncbi:5'-nucleotidase C-terminal domain-containing protein [Niameybacter massiliensis]|uniref:5'-nucleotidase C-terminal domain-containing protein n=1 Tax=Holtiella tumoricola TaxID=3018743 RepID=A0AA42DSV0_9FIRM|nr:5'-nucleotidase C-terminal domain-containing protein [Holtiella tumoricola]MDA3734226.1 5'-nucleotidase C-terminal domain-containing protein [Holtiella tumoricola]